MWVRAGALQMHWAARGSTQWPPAGRGVVDHRAERLTLPASNPQT